MSNAIAGRIKHFLPFWQYLTEDRKILQTVRGLKLNFIGGVWPWQITSPLQVTFNLEEAKAVDMEICRLLEKGVIVHSVHSRGEFVNSIFTRPKKDGKHRMILNLKPLNKFIAYNKFKMDTIKSVLQLMHKDCFMASIDIADAYYSVPIAKEYQKFLKFKWKGQLYQYTALPNGYSDAPRVFTKLLKPVLAQIRRQGHIVVGYIDDLYIQGSTEAECVQAVNTAAQLLRNCGFIIHPEKSCFKPVKTIVYLGFELNSANMTASVTQEKKTKYIQSCSELMALNVVPIRRVAKVTGQVVSTFPGVPYGPLHYRHMEKAKILALFLNDQDFDANITVTADIKTDLAWWIQNLPSAYYNILPNKIEVEIKTDATLENWGVECGSVSSGGPFTDEERKWSKGNINACEMLAVFLSLKAFENTLCGKNVLVRSDNMVTIAYIAHMGGIKSILCDEIARKIWAWCIERKIWLSAEHIPGIMNIYADFESRHVNDRLEWAIYPVVFDLLCKRFGTPEIDLFATRLNAKLDKYVSWRPDPGAISVNAFAMSWCNTYVYMFPPFSLINKCLQQLRIDGTDALMIFPLWPTQPWFATLTQMMISMPVLLPKDKLVYMPNDPQRSHPLPHLRLCACRLSGDPKKPQAFLNKLSTSFATHGAKGPKNNMVLHFRNGRHIVIKGKSIIMNHL